MSVLLKNRQLVFSMQNYIWYTSGIFSISSLAKISLTSFLCFSSSFFLFLKHSYLCNKKNYSLVWTYEVYVFVEKRFHSKINFTCSRQRVISSIYLFLFSYKSKCKKLEKEAEDGKEAMVSYSSLNPKQF